MYMGATQAHNTSASAVAQHYLKVTTMCTYNTRTATPLRTARVMRVATAKHNRNKAAYTLQVQQLQAQYGVASTSAATRSNTAVYARSSVQGACKQVHAIAAANGFNRALTLAACKAAGINPATAATQFATAKRAQATVA